MSSLMLDYIVSFYIHGWKFLGLFLNSGFWGWLSMESQPHKTEFADYNSFSDVRNIPEFRILRLAFHRKSASKYWIRQIIISLSDLFSDNLKIFDHSSMKLLIFCRHTASFDIWISEVQNFGNFELSPMFTVYCFFTHHIQTCPHPCSQRLPCKQFGPRSGPTECGSWPQGYKTLFMLNSTEHEISTAHKN